MSLNPGKINTKSYDGSMAQAIEEAFIEVWPSIMNPPAPPISNEMKLLFIAVAQGVVKHIQHNADAFNITASTSGNHTHTSKLTISATNVI